MYTLTYLDRSFDVDHAVKGPDYVHGYDANGICVVSIDGVTSFDDIYFDGEYMDPAECASEACRTIRYVGGALVCTDGTAVQSVSGLRIAGQPWFYIQNDKPADWQNGDVWIKPKQ